MTQNLALVAGASGIIGKGVVEAITEKANWRNQAFNYVHEPFRWERVWQQVADGLGLDVAPPMKMTLARQMADKGPLWSQLAAAHGLKDTPYDQLVGWPFGDFIFNTEFDMISDMGKIRRAGFNETIDSGEAVLGAIRRLVDEKVLPPF